MIEEIFKNKPDSIYDIIAKDSYYKWDNSDYMDLGHGNCFEWYYAIAKTIKPKTFLEIGVRYGFSFMPTLLGGGETLEYALGWDLETYDYKSNRVADNNIKDNYNGNCHWEIKHVDSQLENNLPQFFDLVSIDGCHDYDCKIHDLELALTNSRYVIIDDYDYHTDVRNAVDKFLRDHSYWVNGRFNPNSKIEWSLYIPSFRGSQLIKFK